jgi:hypothetical protein
VTRVSLGDDDGMTQPDDRPGTSEGPDVSALTELSRAMGLQVAFTTWMLVQQAQHGAPAPEAPSPSTPSRRPRGAKRNGAP